MAHAALGYRIARQLDLVGAPVPPTGGEQYPERNAPSPLGVFLPWLARRGERRRQRLASEALDRGGLDGVLAELADDIETQQTLELPADGRWHDTGLDLEPGEAVTVLAAGRLFVSRPLEVSVGPRAGLWYRVGDADIQRMARESEQVVADSGGRLALCIGMPGAFDSPQGETNPDNPNPSLSGALEIRLIRWATAPAAYIEKAARLAPAVFDPLRRQIDASGEPPAGWHYFWRIGKADIFHTRADDDALCCETSGDVGILQYPVDVKLDHSLRLSWSWLVEVLPSQLPEHIQPTHDYLSIAVEFDNGLDLTYMWSAELAEDTIFQCPLPWWDQRETHWVLRNTNSAMGRWHDEQRGILADYQHAIAGPAPERVVAIWLIANSAFQNNHGRCYYRHIKLENADTTVAVPVQ